MGDSAQDVLDAAMGHLPGWAAAVLKARLREATSNGSGAEPLPPAKKRGLMVALMLPLEAAQKLAQPGGEPAERLHCTLAYPGRVEDLAPDCIERVTRAVSKVAAEFAPFVGLVGGAGRFNASTSSDGREVLHACLDAPVLGALQQAIARAMDDEKCPPKREHGFDPHVTLRYQEKGASLELPPVPTLPVVFQSIAIVAGDERVAEVPLAGTRVLKEHVEEVWGLASKDLTASDAHVPAPLGAFSEEPEEVEDAADRLAELESRGLTREQARARVRAELKLEGKAREVATEIVAAADRVEKARPMSREYLEEAWNLARKLLPPWAWASIHQQAMPRAGVRAAAAHRADAPTLFEKLALTDVRPAKLRELPDDELRLAWLRLHQWFANAKRAKKPVEDFVNAALWTMDEMGRRSFEVERDDELVRAIDELRGKRGSLDTFAKLNALPKDLVVVRDFVSVIGSTAKGDKEPSDLDVLVRAPWDREKGSLSIQAENLWLPIRNVLGEDKLHLVDNPQGAHGDFIPLYDLVLRRRDKIATEVVKGFPNGVAEVGVHVHNLEREASRTKSDGAHAHLYVLPDGREVWTEEDGAHEHALTSQVADVVVASGKHKHRVVIDGQELWTDEDGEHAHQLQAWSSAFDGIHKHKLLLPDGKSIENLMPGEYWTHAGKPPQADAPPAPAATELAKDAPIEPAKDAPPADLAKDAVPSVGPEGAPIAFVGSSLSKLEAARREPFVGQAGDTLNELYLKPLGLARAQVAIVSAVPAVLLDDKGEAREPTDEEMTHWSGWLDSELERLKPKVVVALGQVAKRALGDRAAAVLPHPAAVRRFGNSGEIDRKLRRVRELAGIEGQRTSVRKQPRGEGDEETSAERAFETWERTWHEQLPKSGKGRFVYQHHWRGLDEEQARSLGDEALLKTDHSVHGDLRLEGEDGLWGWAVLIGSAADNAKAGGDKLLAMSEGKLEQQEKLQLANKLPQPETWLHVGSKEPMVVEPGGVGATANKWSKFFALDEGTYELGVARQHGVEIFLDGKHLKGRYLISFAPVGDRRVWLIDKPQDQRPTGETRELADLIGELRRKRQRFLIWGAPGKAPQKIDVMTGKVLKSAVVPLLKERTREDKRIVYGVVLDPYIVDAHQDWVPPSVVEETAHGWFRGSRSVTLHHKTGANAEAVESHLEPYPSRRDYESAMQAEPHKVWRRQYGDDAVNSGAWIIGVKLSPELWEAYKRDEIAAFSIEGFGMRTPATTKDMPRVTFVDLVERK